MATQHVPVQPAIAIRVENRTAAAAATTIVLRKGPAAVRESVACAHLGLCMTWSRDENGRLVPTWAADTH